MKTLNEQLKNLEQKKAELIKAWESQGKPCGELFYSIKRVSYQIREKKTDIRLAKLGA